MDWRHLDFFYTGALIDTATWIASINIRKTLLGLENETQFRLTVSVMKTNRTENNFVCPPVCCYSSDTVGSGVCGRTDKQVCYSFSTYGEQTTSWFDGSVF